MLMMKVLLQGTEGVVGLAWASIDDTCRLNYNVRMEVIVVLVININDNEGVSVRLVVAGGRHQHGDKLLRAGRLSGSESQGG